MKDTEYYNKESSYYSDKRYPDISRDYTHFFFKKRLSILLNILKKISCRKKGQNLLEVGCADGFVSLAINDLHIFENITGIDVSADMIQKAIENNHFPQVSFFVRGQENLSALYDVIVEVGVLNLTNEISEFEYAKKHLKQNGYYICSIAANTSIRSRLKFKKDGSGFSHLLTFKEYERKMSEKFEIVKSIPYGFFIPYLWKFAVIGRILQPSESILRSFAPNLFHEKAYLLKKK